MIHSTAVSVHQWQSVDTAGHTTVTTGTVDCADRPCMSHTHTQTACHWSSSCTRWWQQCYLSFIISPMVHVLHSLPASHTQATHHGFHSLSRPSSEYVPIRFWWGWWTIPITSFSWTCAQHSTRIKHQHLTQQPVWLEDHGRVGKHCWWGRRDGNRTGVSEWVSRV